MLRNHSHCTGGLFFFALFGDIPNGGLTNFFSQLIVGFGYTPEQSLLYGTPAGAVEVVTLIVGGYLGDRLGNRMLVAVFGLLCAITGVSLIVGLPFDNDSGRLGGYYLTQASAMPFVALLSLIGSNVVRFIFIPSFIPSPDFLMTKFDIC